MTGPELEVLRSALALVHPEVVGDPSEVPAALQRTREASRRSIPEG